MLAHTTTVLALVLAVGAPAALAVNDPDELMPGKVTVIKPGALAKFVSRPATSFGLPSATNDPTSAGGTLRMFDTGAAAGDDTYALPAAQWTALGTGGFRYAGAGTPADPCRVVLVKPTLVKAVCRDGGVTLTPPFAGHVGIVLTLGTASKRYCADFGGTTVKNQPGLLKRRDAPAPTSCPGAAPTTSTSSSTTSSSSTSSVSSSTSTTTSSIPTTTSTSSSTSTSTSSTSSTSSSSSSTSTSTSTSSSLLPTLTTSTLITLTTSTSSSSTTSSSLAPTTTSSVTTTSTSSSTSTTAPLCCGPQRITLVSSAGTLIVDNLAPFTFPTGVITTMDIGPATGAPGECKHSAILPAGGFFVPHFDIPALNYCSEVIDLHCESGTGEGAGFLWDGLGTAGLAMTNITKAADTSDGVCNPAGQPCTSTAGGAGANTLGDVDETFSVAAGGGVRSALDIRAESRTWSDSTCSPAITPGCCVTANYGDDTAINGELLITLFDFVLSPTTNTATAAFVDKNSDGCKRSGSGFSNPGPDGPKSLTGAPAAGPCCTVAQPTTVVAVGVGFSGGAPLFDLGFQSTIPNTVAACGTAGSSTCVVTTDPCLQ